MNDPDTKTTITATEFKMNLGQYLEYAIDGHEVTITKNGREAVKLLPFMACEKQGDAVNEKAIPYQYQSNKVSYEDFLALYEKSDARMEYMNGELIQLASPGIRHQEISGNLHLLLCSYLKGKKCKVFYAPFDVHLFKKNMTDPDVVQPDLLIACDLEEKTNAKGRYSGVPTLVIEILSQGTRSKDMVDKLNTYLLSGVREYWIVDPEKGILLVYGFKDYEIDDFQIYKRQDKLKSYFFEGLEVDPVDIFGD